MEVKGLRFETGLIVILVMFALTIIGALIVNERFERSEERLDRLERIVLLATPDAGDR